jgi:hypothetical protein
MISAREDTLEVLHFALGIRISELELKHSHHVDWTIERVCGDIEARLDMMLAGKGPEEVRFYRSRTVHRTFDWPETWWDAFKARWFPSWALRRWPPTMHREVVDEALVIDEKIDVYALFPGLPLKIGQHSVRYRVQEESKNVEYRELTAEGQVPPSEETKS